MYTVHGLDQQKQPVPIHARSQTKHLRHTAAVIILLRRPLRCSDYLRALHMKLVQHSGVMTH